MAGATGLRIQPPRRETLRWAWRRAVRVCAESRCYAATRCGVMCAELHPLSKHNQSKLGFLAYTLDDSRANVRHAALHQRANIRRMWAGRATGDPHKNN